MNCPYCNHHTKVLESRAASSESSIRRRRECLKCKARFSTVEELEILDLRVTKRDGSKEYYSHEKLVSGLHKALEKRQFTPESFKKLVSSIEKDIQINTKNDSSITSNDIGEIVMRYLKKFDQVAYVRFASVYRDFKEPADFMAEVQKL